MVAPADAKSIEIAIGEAIVRIIGQVKTGLITAVLRAVRRSSLQPVVGVICGLRELLAMLQAGLSDHAD